MLDNLEYNSFLLSSARLLVYLHLVSEQVILKFTMTKQIISDFFLELFLGLFNSWCNVKKR